MFGSPIFVSTQICFTPMGAVSVVVCGCDRDTRSQWRDTLVGIQPVQCNQPESTYEENCSRHFKLAIGYIG